MIEQHPEFADELREFFAKQDAESESSQTGADAATIPPGTPTSDTATIPPSAGANEDATIPPAAEDTDAATIQPTEQVMENMQVGTKVRYFGDYELLEEIARGAWASFTKHGKPD